jgi:Tfp pilus assembly protein PilX
MKPSKTNRQKGIALFSALMILLLLSAIAASLVMMGNTETSVNANYRAERTLDFAARAGIEEVRDRLMPSNAATLISPTCAPASACLAANPVVPSTINNGILYVLGGPTPAAVTPWTAGTIYTDDELCHDGYGIVAVQSSDVRCTAVPAGGGWYASTTSNTPWNGTAAALSYEWVRVSWKLNGSVQNYPVDTASCPAAGSAGCTTPVCFNGAQEVLLPAADTACGQMSPIATPVYLLTSLAVNPISGTRKIVQAEAALPPPVQDQQAGFFATSPACGAFTMTGGGTTDGYTTAGGGTYAKTKSNSTGSIGSNGNVSLSGNKTKVGGNIYVPVAVVGACPDGVSESGGAGVDAGDSVVAQGAQAVPPPPLPNPLPPTTGLSNPASLVPGNYGNISLTGHDALTVAPGVYNINSISMTGGSTLTISPAGAVVFNVVGTGQATPIDLEGGGLMNTTQLAANFQLNYAGAGNIKFAGGSGSYAVINAPNASMQFTGGSDFYGSATGATITDTGGTNLHFDTSLLSNLNSTATHYTEISLRGVAY